MPVCRSRRHFRWCSRWPCQSPRQPIASADRPGNRLAPLVTPGRKCREFAPWRYRARHGVGVAQHTFAMTDPFLGSEALAARLLSRHELRSRYVALHRDVYVARDAELTAVVRAKAAWLRSRRRGVLAGFSAAALHGSKWIDAARPAEIIDTNRRHARGVPLWEERIECDEITVVDGMAVTTPARTALDLARRHPMGVAVAAIDRPWVQATELKMADVELLVSYRGRHDIKAARAALALVDGGAQSPKESWLRVLLIDAGFPRPQTQIPVRNEWGWAEAYLDMGWEEIKVAAEYDGDQHRASRYQYVKDIRRLEMLDGYGWIVVRVIAEDRPDEIIRRVRDVRRRRS
uniref:MAV346 n=1 Tax=Mycobacterium avium TaxID=1764 RepID=O07396_MYCAV|nr:MAV346 [Mycobacterium avium]